ncbi:MAG: restriction endonuclease subunit S [Chlorobiaceae bacterium]
MSAEVNPGYKLTEVGVIPEDWEVKTIDEVGFVTSGKRLPLGSSLTERETSHPYVRVTDMRFGNVSLSDIKFVPDLVYPAISRYRIFRDDIFISVAGTLGIAGKVPDELDGANLTENADRITKITCCQEYLLHVLMSPLIQNTIQSLQTVGAQPKLALTRIRKFAISFPPTKAEQEAIAEALSDADALIESLEQLITKKHQIKQGAMQELLTGKKRLPGFSGEWEVKLFDDVLIRVNTKVNQIQTIGYQMTGVYPVIDQGKVAVIGFSDREDKLLKCPEGGVIVFGDHTCIVKFIDFDFLVGADGTQIIQGRSGQSTIFHAFQLQYRGVEPTGYNRHFKFLKERNFLMPKLPEQTAIANVLSDMGAEIDALETKLAKVQKIKRGMMYNLLTGKIRLT